MRYLLSAPSQIKATIQLPASKSISNRALIIHALSKGDDVSFRTCPTAMIRR